MKRLHLASVEMTESLFPVNAKSELIDLLESQLKVERKIREWKDKYLVNSDDVYMNPEDFDNYIDYVKQFVDGNEHDIMVCW